MAREFFTDDHDVGEHKDKQCEVHGYLISRNAKNKCMKCIVWNRKEDAITPMENIEQTTCSIYSVCILIPYPNGVCWLIEKRKPACESVDSQTDLRRSCILNHGDTKTRSLKTLFSVSPRLSG